MRASLLLSIVLATGCSEYGFLGPHRDDQPPESETPGGTPDAPDDRDEPIANGEPDCALAPNIEVYDFPLTDTWDFDAEGRALFVASSYPGVGYDILGTHLDGTREPIASSIGTSNRKPERPRVLPDGSVVYLVVDDNDAGTAYNPTRLGLYDLSEGRELRLTAPDFDVYTIEPDVDGTVYAYGAPIIDSGRSDVEVRRYDLYSGYSQTIVDFDDPRQLLVFDIAWSPDGDVLYLAGSFEYETTGVVYAVPRLDSWEWGEPVEIWSGDQRIHGIAVDACNNLYISEGERLLVLPPGGDEAAHILDLPGYLVQPFWGSGGGNADTKVLFGNFWRGIDYKEFWGFVAIDLGVDGTHILAE